MRVSVRTRKTILIADLALTDALAFINECDHTDGLSVVLPNGDLINAGRPFNMFVRTVMGAKKRMGL